MAQGTAFQEQLLLRWIYIEGGISKRMEEILCDFYCSKCSLCKIAAPAHRKLFWKCYSNSCINYNSCWYRYYLKPTNKTLTSPDINTPDIDGGAIDGAVIGATTAAAGTFAAVGTSLR